MEISDVQDSFCRSGLSVFVGASSWEQALCLGEKRHMEAFIMYAISSVSAVDVSAVTDGIIHQESAYCMYCRCAIIPNRSSESYTRIRSCFD